MKELSEFHLDKLLAQLRDDPASVLSKIDADEKINKRQHKSGLIIANASKSLFTPEYEHQLFAKGIVYRRDPYEVVSLPLIKIYNHTERGMVDDLTYRLAEEDSLRICVPFKDDGYLGQIFDAGTTAGHFDRVYCTTRSMLEGVPVEHSFDFPYVGAIRALANMKYPGLINPDIIKDLTITCEVIHPGAESGITRYGDRQDMVVIAVFDKRDFTYWSNARLQAWCKEHGFKAVETLATDATIEEAVSIVREMEDDPDVPEGAVVCFEDGDRVVHRVKIKTMKWCQEFALRFSCSTKTVTRICFGKPELESWENFEAHLIEEGLTSEETLEYYRDYHDEYTEWLQKCRDEAREFEETLATCLEAIAPVEKDKEQKALALYAREHYRESFPVIMNLYNAERDDEALFAAMWQNELWSGIKGLILDAKKEAKNAV